MKKIAVWFISIFIVIMLAISVINVMNVEDKVYIFSDIHECKEIVKDLDQTQLEIYDDHAQDEYFSEELKYNNFFAAKYSAEDLNFEFFAYEFENVDMAREYYKKVSGKEIGEKDKSFSSGWNTFYYKTIVIENTRVYRAYTKGDHKEEMEKLFEDSFTIQLY